MLSALLADPPPQLDGAFPAGARRKLRMQCPMAPNAFSEKAFAHWAPRKLQEALSGTLLPPDIPRPPRPEKTSKGQRPEDEDPVVQAAFYGRLTFEFAQVSEYSPDGRVRIWTDGGKDTINGRAIAGAGIFYGNNNPRNAAFSVTNPATNQRAELAAFMHVLRTDPRPLHVVTDSTYVHQGFSTWRHNWRARAFFKHPLDAEEYAHSDLWREIDALLARRPPNSVQTSWTKRIPESCPNGSIRCPNGSTRTGEALLEISRPLLASFRVLLEVSSLLSRLSGGSLVPGRL